MELITIKLKDERFIRRNLILCCTVQLLFVRQMPGVSSIEFFYGQALQSFPSSAKIIPLQINIAGSCILQGEQREKLV